MQRCVFTSRISCCFRPAGSWGAFHFPGGLELGVRNDSLELTTFQSEVGKARQTDKRCSEQLSLGVGKRVSHVELGRLGGRGLYIFLIIGMKKY